MARAPTKSLVLEISGDVSKLNVAQKAARSALLSMKNDAEGLEEAFDKAWAGLGGDAATQARQAEREWSRMFASIKRNAQAMVAEGNSGKALKLFDVGEADEQVRALTTQAGLLRQQAIALDTAAAEGGEYAVRQREIAAALMGSAKEMEAQALAIDHTASALRGVVPPIERLDDATQDASRSNGAFAAGMQNVGFQASDFVVQVSGGTSAMRAFAMQGPQMVQALALMGMGAENTNSRFGRFAGFLAGPWGAAITVGVSVVGLLATSLLELDDAAEAAELGADGLGQAQGVLGRMFDLTTGKIKDQNEMLRINALLMARNLEAEARTKRSSARDVLIRAQEGGADGFFEAQTVGIAGLEPTTGARNAAALKQLMQSIGSGPGQISRSEAIKRAEGMDFAGTRVTRDEFIGGLRDAQWANENDRIARQIRQSLADNQLAPGLRQDASDSKDRAKKRGPSSAEIAGRFDDQLLGYTQQSLNAMQQLAETTEEKAELELRSIEWTRRQRLAEIDADENYSAAQKAELKAAAERLSGFERDVVEARKRQQLMDEQLQADTEALQGKSSVLRLQAQLATSLADRRRIAEQILDLEMQERKAAADRLLNSDNAQDRAQGQRMLDQIETERPVREEQIRRDNLDPVERYLEGLRQSAEEADEALKRVQANGLQNLEDGLVGILSGTETVKGAFKRMANQIIADLIRIQVQRMILGSIGGGLLGLLGGGGGPANLLASTGFAEGGVVEGFAGGGRVIRGPGTGTSDSIFALVDGRKPILVSNGESILTAEATKRYWPLIEAMNAGTLPGFAAGGIVSPAMPSLPRLPAAGDLRREGSSAQDRLQVDVRAKVEAGPMLDARIQEVSVQTVAGASEPLISAAEGRTRRNLERPRLPGGYA
ncbi:hypothetical protein AEB_P2055 [Altererythrobacter sp. B11]|uniref:phage tail tape measure C-terminal domain-containing protein n=1 Tax=Altererythrobacter sp. B11 TaxID=2060312 RepID=UPI000DC70CF2|nr:phage tail tape measure C-terminal domain-containing protein [Altererythrobacter sp. B11]BBC72923.1 hypothetical protein AEB_P2055 [Altererythrobacter sp. B11]